MASIKLKWWALDEAGNLYCLPKNNGGAGGAPDETFGVIIENDGALRDFAYKCFWQLYVELPEASPLKRYKGNCMMMLPHEFGKERIEGICEFLEETLRGLAGVHPAHGIAVYKNIAYGQSTSGSGGRVVPSDDGADLTLA